MLTIQSSSQNNEIEFSEIDQDNEVSISLDFSTYWIDKESAELIIQHLKEQFGL